MGFFFGLNSEAYDRQYTDRELAVRILSYFKPHRARVLGISGIVTLLALADAAQPLIVSRGLDILIATPQSPWIGSLVGIVLILGIVHWVGNWWRRRATVRIISDVIMALRHDAFSAAIRHDMSFFDEFRTGKIISRITSDTEEFAQVAQLLTDFISQLVMVVLLLIVLFGISWQLTLILLAVTPMAFFVALGFRRIARDVTRKGFQVLAEVNASIQESISGIAVAKNFRQEGRIYQEFSRVNGESFKVNLRRGLTLATLFPVLNALSGIGTAILVYGGGIPASVGAITIGAWNLFVTSVDRFWFPVMNASAFWSQIQGGLSAAERLFALMDAQPTVHQTDNLPAPQLKGALRFEDVHFRYTTQEQVLEDFDLEITPGENIAFVGHTGAGKSSIARLIARFYEFQKGRILVDDHDIRTLDLAGYRRQLGIVSQAPYLFSGTVADNIRYARPGLSDAEIYAVARQIGEGEWLETLPQGLQSDVGERGARLSMGQRQLVALVRVLVQEPAIFILDEATASIDPFTEMQIQDAISLILRRSTSILIAHRLSTVRAVDRIIVLKKGRIIEMGSHTGLLQQGGHYAELYDTYFRHQSPDYRPAPVAAP